MLLMLQLRRLHLGLSYSAPWWGGASSRPVAPYCRGAVVVAVQVSGYSSDQENLKLPSWMLKQNGELVPPREPGPEDCCQSGCAVCVWDLYKDELQQYEDRVQALRAADGPNAPPALSKPARKPQHAALAEASMDAFSALERQLELQAEQRRATGASINLHSPEASPLRPPQQQPQQRQPQHQQRR